MHRTVEQRPLDIQQVSSVRTGTSLLELLAVLPVPAIMPLSWDFTARQAPRRLALLTGV